MRKAFIGILAVGMVAMWVGGLSGTAWAAGAGAKSSERQVVPGLTERTIWGRDQVYVYRLPRNVTHTGDLHVELTYTPADGDCFIYLLGPVAKGSSEWQVCPGTYGQGFLSLWPGREVIDYAVPEVLDRDPVDEGVRGDTYYVVVQAANDLSRFRLSGYVPSASGSSSDTTSEATFTRSAFQTPASATKSIAVSGAAYGGPFDFTPTSLGQVECRLQYPADPKRKTVEAASPALKASFEQYVYPPFWEPKDGAVPVSQPTDPSHWDLYGQNRHAAAPLTGDDWYGLQGAFAVQADGPWTPGLAYHYVPVLWLAAAQPYVAAPARPGAPATGLRTVGYKATPAGPAEPAVRVRYAQGAEGPFGEAGGHPRPARRRDAGRLGILGSRGHACDGAAEDRLQMGHREGREDPCQRFVACVHPREEDHAMARLVAERGRYPRRVLPHQEHRRQALTPAIR